ncbi:DUF1273 domain-containing protein [Halobacillus salinarum]|uniref:DUF1273 domain-containing protein n=1 Tax=Halobacillus salinarum TaxID=2932257 RepID=A0ABY4EGK3_9BACI|nr:DUF1273 domain-containing protein [Halobacillus salinarum]UOQ42749.1 DUF1273 domain-containing protein [Halobacillus salinarum]
MKTIVITGYKPMEMGIFKYDDPKIDFIKKTIMKKLVSLLEEGLEWVLISAQMGVEIWAGQAVLDLQKDYDVHLGVLPPFENQHERWPEAWKEAYEELTMVADFYQPIYNSGYEGPFQFKAKDKFLVAHSQGCLVLFDEETKGSPEYFLKEAENQRQTKEYPVLYITPLDLEETVEEIRMSDSDYFNQ